VKWGKIAAAFLILVGLFYLIRLLSGYRSYGEVLQTVETVVEILILYFVIKEGSAVVEKVSDIYDSTATTSTVVGVTEDLQVGNRVQVLNPEPGKTRDQWGYSQDVWVIREVDKEKKRATATPVLPRPNQPIPTVSGPMSGPLSPFIKLTIPS